MKIINKIYSLLAAVMILVMASCSPDEFGLGDKNLSSEDLAENIAFTITHDESNPNIVKFKSLLPSSYSVVFDTPQGRFQQDEVSLKILSMVPIRHVSVLKPAAVSYGDPTPSSR